MEIPQIDDEINHSTELNNKLLKLYKSYVMYSQDVVVRDEKKFIGSIYDNETVVLRIDYIVLGSFSKDKNVWIWADQSQSINKSTKITVSNLRTTISETIGSTGDIVSNLDKDLIEKLKNFTSVNYLVLSTSELCRYLNYISTIISTKIKGSVLLTTERGGNIDVLVVKKILFNNIKN